MPVNANEPCNEPRNPAHSNGAARILSKNRAAATIGPMVWDDDGPTPILNISKTDKNIFARAFQQTGPQTGVHRPLSQLPPPDNLSDAAQNCANAPYQRIMELLT